MNAGLSAFFDALDEVRRTPTSVLFETPAGETRTVPITALRGQPETRSKSRPRLERRRQLLALLEALAEKDGEAL